MIFLGFAFLGLLNFSLLCFFFLGLLPHSIRPKKKILSRPNVGDEKNSAPCRQNNLVF